MREQRAAHLIQTAYMVNKPEAEWLSGIADAARRFAVDSPGVVVRYIEARAGLLMGMSAASSPFPSYVSALEEMGKGALAEPARAATLLSRTRAFRSSELAAELGCTASFSRLFTRRTERFGEVDTLHLVGADDGGKALCLHIGISSGETRAIGTKRVWNQMAMHLAAAARLRRAVAPLVRADAAHTPLRQAAEAADRDPTSRLKPALDSTLDPWRRLIDGHWSVMDAFDSGGRRIIMLCPNPPELVEDCRLTRRERQVIAEIGRGGRETKTAVTLGISISTVRTHLARALEKLRIARVTDLMVLVAAMNGERP